MIDEKTAEDITKFWLERMTDEQAIIVAERILEDYFDNPRAVKLYPVVYRERVTHQERDQLTLLLSTIRVSENDYNLRNIMTIIPGLGTVCHCPQCGKLVTKGIIEHYDEGQGEWKCPQKQI